MCGSRTGRPAPSRSELPDPIEYHKGTVWPHTYNRLHAHPYRWTYTGEALTA